MPSVTIGHVEIRDVDGGPSRIEGLALPYNVETNIFGGRERFRRGAFADQVRAVNGGERLAYLSRHGVDGGVMVATIDQLEERDDGLYFGASILPVPEAAHTVAQIASGVNGVSPEFVPPRGKGVSRKGDVTEYTAGVRLAAIAASYAPAYITARASLRDAPSSAERNRTAMPNLSVNALTERRDAIQTEANAIRMLAETEERGESTEDRDALTAIDNRIANINALISSAAVEAERRDTERSALPARPAGTRSPAIVTRSETIYGPGTERSYFADLMIASRDSQAAERLHRHRMLVTDLSDQIERRAVETSELAGAYPTNYYPDLYVADIAYTGPLSAFFQSQPIAAPNPIVVPTFASVTGDTAPQSAENAVLATVDPVTAPKTLTPKTIGGETIVARQAVDGASPGTDRIIGGQLREMLMRDTEREIALVLEALAATAVIPDTAGVVQSVSGRDLFKGFQTILGQFYAGAAAGGAGARFLPAEGIFANSTSWGALVAAEDTTGRPLMPYIAPTNSNAQYTNDPGFQRGIIGGVPTEPAWAILSAVNEIVARRNDAVQFKSAILDVRLMEREGPQSVVFAIWQYFGFVILEPKGVRKYTYTDV